MKVKMLKTQSGTEFNEQGISMGAKDFMAGQEYEISDPKLAKVFVLDLKCAVHVGSEPKAEAKMSKKKPEDKRAKPKSENKGLFGKGK